MRMVSFARRCAKEILRDPLNLCFGLGFPLVLLVLLSSLQANIPVELFEIDKLTPGISVFGLSFMTLFSATLIAKDKESAFLQRLYATPLKGLDFIAGYMLPLLPISIAQTLICYLFAIPIGLTVSIRVVYAIVGLLHQSDTPIKIGREMITKVIKFLLGQIHTDVKGLVAHQHAPSEIFPCQLFRSL